MEKFTPKEKEVVLTAKDLISMDISKMSELEFKTMVIKDKPAGLGKKSMEDTRKSLLEKNEDLIRLK